MPDTRSSRRTSRPASPSSPDVSLYTALLRLARIVLPMQEPLFLQIIPVEVLCFSAMILFPFCRVARCDSLVPDSTFLPLCVSCIFVSSPFLSGVLFFSVDWWIPSPHLFLPRGFVLLLSREVIGFIYLLPGLTRLFLLPDSFFLLALFSLVVEDIVILPPALSFA